MTFDMVILGDIVADIIMPIDELPLRPNEHGWAEGLYTELGGGCNFLVSARRLDLSTTALGAVGGDIYGEQLKQMLAAEDIDITHLITVESRQTVLCVVVTDKAGRHVFLGIKDEGEQWPCPDEWEQVIRDSRSLLTDGYTFREMLRPDDVLRMMRVARNADVPVFFDPGPSITFIPTEVLNAALEVTDVLLLTFEEAQHLVEAGEPDIAGQALHTYGPTVVVVKEGANGCYVVTAEETVHHPGFDVDVVDTVGAGDAFGAAFVAGYLRDGNWRECAALANAMGAATAATQGAGRRIPPVDTLLQLLDDDSASRLVRPQEEPAT